MSGIQSIREGLTGNVTRVIVVAIIITFIGSVGWAGFFSQGNVNVVASVGSKEITNADLNFEVSTQQFALSQRFPDQEIDDETLFTLSKNNLINKFSILDFLDSKKTILTDEFIYTQLADEEQFQENGRFSKARFESFARSNGFIPSDYLKRVREDFLISIWRQSIINSSFITDAEVVGRSPILGKPMAMMLLNENATVSICHSKTTNLEEHLIKADIIVGAVGIPKFIKSNWIKDGAVVIDAGYHPEKCGDIDLEGIIDRCSAYTPVPGGVGPMTINTLILQTVEACEASL